jgi:hypothetical protein
VNVNSQIVRFGYDASGNMTGDGQNTLTYNAVNEAASVNGSLGSGSYSYAASGHRLVTTSSGSTTVVIYSGGQPVAEYVNGTLTKEYVYLGRQLLASYESGTLYYHHSDHLSVRLTTDANGNKVGEQGHYPYGEEWYMTNTTTKLRLTT